MTTAIGFGPINSSAAHEFVVTKSKPVNMRIGPGRHYSVQWVYTKRFMPLMVIARTEGWAKVEDCEGATGWIANSMLTKKNYVTPRTDGAVFLHTRSRTSAPAFTADTCVAMKLEKCKGDMCKVSLYGLSGWITKQDLWGRTEDSKKKP